MTTNLKQEERLDDLQIHGYEIIQHPGRFCFGMDAVLLLILLQSKRERARWILEQERESFQSFWKQRQKGNILLGWRSRKKVRIWRKEVWHTIIWSRR